MNLLKFLQHRHSKKIAQSAELISVYEKHPYRWILFNYKFIQSMIDIKRPHRIILPYLHYFLIFARKRPGNILLLGLGGGSAVHVLHHQNSNRKLTVIEKYATMIKLAQHYFFLPATDNIKILCQSAEMYLMTTTSTYAHILIDLGDEHGYPADCKTKDFFKSVYEHLAPEGIVCLNLSSHRELAEIKQRMTEVFLSPPLLIEAESNWILTHCKLGKAHLLGLLQAEGLIKSHFWSPELGETLVLRSEKQALILSRIKSILGFSSTDKNHHHLD